MMRCCHRLVRTLVLGLCLSGLALPTLVRAGILEDDEARRAILDLRQKLEQQSEQQRVRSAEQAEQAAKRSEQTIEQLNALQRSLLDLNTQLELLRSAVAQLRGQNEQLARDVSELQRKQKDLQSGVDDRIRRIEPQKVSVDGAEFLVDPEEKRQYDEAMEVLRKGDFAATAQALGAFRKRYPSSGYSDSVAFWLGNSQYGVRQYKEAIATLRSLVLASPEAARAPEALLAIANCQAELKDNKSARRTLDELLKTYPKSEAAQAGKERLASLKP
jgi:tol-pal system protein YbgF